MPKKANEKLIDSKNKKGLSKGNNNKKIDLKEDKNIDLKSNTKAVKTSSSKKSSPENAKSIKKSSSKAKKTTVKVNMKHLTEYYDLPYSYNKTVVKVLAQTPKTLFVYWEISDDDRLNYIKNFGEDFFNTTKPFLVVTNNTKNYSFEIEINDFANSWYFNIFDEACDYSVELIRKPIPNSDTADSKISDRVSIAVSNEIESPNGHILFDKISNNLYFRNVKTNDTYSKDIANLSFMKKINKIYTTSDLYKALYKDENILELNNPTSN